MLNETQKINACMLCGICTLISSGSSRFFNGVINRIGKIVRVYLGVYCCKFMAVRQPVLTVAEFEASYQSLLFISFQEFVFCTIWTFFYLLAASLAAAYGRYDEAFGAAAVSSCVFMFCMLSSLWWSCGLRGTVLCSIVLHVWPETVQSTLILSSHSEVSAGLWQCSSV